MEELLASQNKKLITLTRGQQIEGEVIAITDREITLDLGAKSEGIIPVREIPQDKLTNLKLGDKIKTYVLWPENESNQVSLAINQPIKTYGKGIPWAKFLQASGQKTKLQGKVVEVNKGGLIVDVGGTRGFLPNSQVGFELLTKSANGMDDLIGRLITVTISEIDQNNNKLIFSQRGQVSDEVRKKLAEFEKGSQEKGKIVAILPFGLVVDIKGSEGLVFISDISWDKVEDLSKMYKAGLEIEVKVLGFDEDLGRLNLSIKHLSEDPFAKLIEQFPADEVVKGVVNEVTNSGVVFKLDQNAEGLLPSSKMDPNVNYEVGKSMSVLVDSVDLQRRRINLTPFITSTEGLIYK